jgi:hypothetical protein
MSLHETPLLRRFWERVGGILVEEFPVVRKAPDHGPRYIDGIIIQSAQHRLAAPEDVSLLGEHITLVQVKRGRLRLTLLGQAFFSIDLIRPFKPASVRSVALCERDDAILRPLFERHPGCKVVTMDNLMNALKNADMKHQDAGI